MINTIEVASRSRENVTHTLFLDEQGKAVGCACEHRQYHPHLDCGHMNEWNVDAQNVPTEKYNFRPYNAEKAQEQARKDAVRSAYNNFCLSMGF